MTGSRQRQPSRRREDEARNAPGCQSGAEHAGAGSVPGAKSACGAWGGLGRERGAADSMTSLVQRRFTSRPPPRSSTGGQGAPVATRRSRNPLGILFLILVGVAGSPPVFAQPRIPREQIPEQANARVRGQIEKLYSEDALTRGQAILELGSMGEEAAPAIPFLIGMYRDHASLRWEGGVGMPLPTSPSQLAKSSFRDMGKPAVVLLVRALGEEDFLLRAWAAWALGYTGSRDAVAPLISALNDASAVMAGAAWSLGVIGDQKAVMPLVLAVEVRRGGGYGARQAVEALGRLRSADAVLPLIRLVADPEASASIRGEAVEALKTITAEDFGLDHQAWAEWWKRQPYSAQQSLQQLGFDPGPIDGVLGEKTRAALRRFQESKGLPPTGKIDPPTVAAIDLDLRQATARAYSRPPSSGARTLRLTLVGNRVTVGDLPYMVPAFEPTGGPSRQVMASTDLRDVNLDLRDLPVSGDPWSPKLGLFFRGEEWAGFVSVRLRNAEQVYIDPDGLVWPDDLQEVAEGGPTITLALQAPDRRAISLDGLSIAVTDPAGMELPAEVLEHEVVRVSNVQEELLRIEVTDLVNGKTWNTDLLPVFRAAGHDVIIYLLKGVTVGRSLEAAPTYE